MRAVLCTAAQRECVHAWRGARTEGVLLAELGRVVGVPFDGFIIRQHNKMTLTLARLQSRSSQTKQWCECGRTTAAVAMAGMSSPSMYRSHCASAPAFDSSCSSLARSSHLTVAAVKGISR